MSEGTFSYVVAHIVKKHFFFFFFFFFFLVILEEKTGKKRKTKSQKRCLLNWHSLRLCLQHIGDGPGIF